jgi:hypothetical protein
MTTPRPATTELSPIEKALIRVDRYISDLEHHLRIHGKSSCHADAACKCIAEAKADLRVLGKDREALLIAAGYLATVE